MHEQDCKYMARFNTGEMIMTDSMKRLYYSVRCFFRICGKAENLYYAGVESHGILRYFVWYTGNTLEIVRCYHEKRQA